MRLRVPTFLVAALLLMACTPQSRPMPDLDDETQIAAAVESLSPYVDGSADRSPDGLYIGQAQSDRRVFLRWLKRMIQHEADTSDTEHYEPFSVPPTIGAALAQQRAYEAERKAQIQAADAAADIRRAAAEQDAADQRAEDARRLAAEKAKVAAAEAEAAQVAEAERLAAEAKAVSDREQQAAAEAKATQPGTGAYNRAWNSFRCS